MPGTVALIRDMQNTLRRMRRKAPDHARKVFREGRAATLIRHDFQTGAFGRKLTDGLDEILAVLSVEPRRANHQRIIAAGKGPQLPPHAWTRHRR